MGEGHKAFNPDKTADEDFYILTLASIAAELRTRDITEANIYLAIGLPTTWTVRQRNAYREYMLRNKKVEFVFNDISYHLHFTQCSVFPQGYAAMVPIMDMDKQYNGFQKFTGTVMMADIGNGTMNIMRLENGRPLDQYCWTEVLGVHQCALTIRKQMMWRFDYALPVSYFANDHASGPLDAQGGIFRMGSKKGE